MFKHMKKTLCALLAFLLLLTVVACTQEDTPVDDDSSSAAEETSSDESSGGGTEVVEIQYETIVSIGKGYESSIKPGDSYPDTFGTELCDGVYATDGTAYTDAKLSGYAVNGGVLNVTFDMGEDTEQLYKFGISYLATKEAGIGGLGSGRILYSDDGENWERGPSFKVPTFEEGKIQQAWATMNTPFNARYVRFEIRGSSYWLFLDELTVIANVSGNALQANYLAQLNASYTDGHPSANELKTGSADIDRSGDLVSATKGRPYTTSYKSGTAFPDSGNLLTNGTETGANYESGEFVGFEGGKELTIDIKFSGTKEGLSEFSLAMYQQANLRHMLPYYVDFYVSEDGKSYDRIGRVYAPEDLTVTNFTFSLHFKKGFSAKAVRFVLAETDTNTFLIEEADASYYGVDNTRPLYPTLELPKVTEAQYWPNASSKVTNLVAGLPYQIVSASELEYATDLEHNTLAEAGVLTDGKYSPNLVYNNGYWNRTRYGGSRNIYFDLGYNSSITGFKINYLQYTDYAINAPATTNLYLSEDGVNWYSVGVAPCSPESKQGTAEAVLNLKTPYEARFACVSFSVSPHTYADEIEIYGTQAITSGTKKLSESSLTPAAMDHFMAPSEDILGGVSDMVLIYYGIKTLNEDFFLPYLAYLDEEGNITDTLFDGFLFLPAVKLPSGGLAHEESEDKPTLWSDWLYQFELDFKEGQHFDALNKAAARVKKELSLPADYKFKVYPTIMYPHVTATNFGDVDGDGVSEDFSKLEDRVKAIDYFMGMYLERFAEESYENLTLEGFYWFAEAIAHEVDDVQTLPAIAEAAENRGTQIFWIPYYQAKGYSNWNSYGFAAANMQPNYVFNESRPVSQLYQAADYIRKLGMGIEIEVNDAAVTQLSFYKRYMRYLGYGIDGGYMKDCIHMYYQSQSAYYDACYSGTVMGRSLYDATYHFIKGTLKQLDKLADFSATCKAGEVLHGNLLEDLEGINTTELVISAEHGSVTIDPHGGYWYVPYEGFTGTDTFTFRYSNFLTWSAETTVTVTVG